MDWEAGEVRFKTSADVDGDRLSLALARQMVEANVVMMDRYLPGLQAVIAGRQTPAAALAEVER
jgi:hypothetical protein